MEDDFLDSLSLIDQDNKDALLKIKAFLDERVDEQINKKVSYIGTPRPPKVGIMIGGARYGHYEPIRERVELLYTISRIENGEIEIKHVPEELQHLLDEIVEYKEDD